MALEAKDRRINLRTTSRQEQLLRRAAEASGESLTEFVLETAVSEAERVLADRRWFAASEAQFVEFTRLLDAPLPTAKLAALFARESVFDRPFHLAD
ncbi:DUF1778 domain-containing protein [Tsukamurella pseudospumae]|uniref:Antitoxin n=1 Tax=Tsukamurella pseudospumae TaxID=239498 RepID=A0A137ZYA9_9ACTN|nr:DUF1778 domain-containing protein [Tsukamurella pseudospumae]KXO98187.1 hypothetical protein AXK61_19310 [Tsukamurella pseudospumae]KXP03129.1 hypothetical protein AXK60_14785 [Tsukamurella pseudospumae]